MTPRYVICCGFMLWAGNAFADDSSLMNDGQSIQEFEQLENLFRRDERFTLDEIFELGAQEDEVVSYLTANGFRIQVFPPGKWIGYHDGFVPGLLLGRHRDEFIEVCGQRECTVYECHLVRQSPWRFGLFVDEFRYLWLFSDGQLLHVRNDSVESMGTL